MFVVKKYPKSIPAESYRNLRTSLEYSSIDKQIKTLVITSAEPGEGKSTVSGNLSFALAQSGKKVVLIDCDLRKPSIHKKFKISNLTGLTNYLIHKNDLDKVIQNIEKNFDLITSGPIPPNPAEVVGSKSMEDLIKKLEENYDYIILDTPPVRAVTDAAILAGKADGTVLVIKADQTKKASLVQGYKELQKVKANVLGTVLNGTSANRNDSYYYYYSEE